MKITVNVVNSELRIIPEGRIDSANAGEFGTKIDESYMEGNIKSVIIDFSKLEYISSAGLRVLLANQKRVSKNNANMKIINVNEMIMDVFNITGFVDILTIE